MDYKKIHDDIIDRARQRKSLDGYSEIHHIVPRCMGGSDEENNLVALTAREHFIVHWLLHMEYPTNKKLEWALINMVFKSSGNQERYVPSSRVYERSRLRVAELNRANVKGRKHMYSPETGDRVLAHPSEFAAYKLKGYIFKGHTKNTGFVNITKGTNNKQVTSDDLPKWIAAGWKRGYYKSPDITYHKWNGTRKGRNNPMYNRTWIVHTKTKKAIVVPNDEVADFLEKGYKKGRK